MQHRNTPEFKKIVALPDNVIMAAFKAAYPGKPVPTTKGALCDAIYHAAHADLDGLLARVGYVAPITRTELEAASRLAEKAIDTSIQLGSDVNGLNNTVNGLNASVNTIASELTRIRMTVNSNAQNADAMKAGFEKLVNEKIGALSTAIGKSNQSADPVEIQAAVTAAVANAFAPFKEAVEKAGAQSVVAEMVEGTADIESAPCKSIFGISAKDIRGNDITFAKVNNPNAPAVDTCFIWTADILRVLGAAAADGGKSTLSNIWANGEKGTGKTETARQFAARTGRPYFRINFQKFTMLEDICGAVGLSGGNTEFQPGPLLKAYTTPFAVVNLDEPSLADPGIMGFLNGLLEPGSVISYGGKTWRRAPGVVVLASDNTNGSGDSTGRYSGTRPQSAALLDRFGLVPEFNYLPKAEEVRALVRHTGCSTELAEYVMDAISACRAKVRVGEIVDAPSIRSVVAFIKLLPIIAVKDAWNLTIAARQPSESAVALAALYTATIDETKLTALV